MSPTDFELALREATQPLGHGFCRRNAAIPELRRVFRARVTREELDQGLRRLRDEGCVRLEPHAHAALPEGEALL